MGNGDLSAAASLLTAPTPTPSAPTMAQGMGEVANAMASACASHGPSARISGAHDPNTDHDTDGP